MVAKLNQVLAIEKGVKARVYGAITGLHSVAKKGELFSGFSKEYTANDDDGEKLPPESKRVQHNARDVLKSTERLSTELMDVIARKDWTNCVAKATVYVDDAPIIENAPVSYLLFLEKQLTDLHTLVATLPILDEAYDWKPDPNTGLYRTDAVKTHRTKKLPKVITLVQPTVEHPGQAQMVAEDVISGYWATTQISGAMRKPEKMALLERIEKLSNAVKEAREAANVQEVVPAPEVGKAIFGYLIKE